MNISCVIQWDVRENRYWQSFISSISYFFLIFSPDLALTCRLWDIANKEVANCIKHGTGYLSFYKWHQDSECRQLPCYTKNASKAGLPSDCLSDRLLLYTSLSLAWLWIQVFFPFYFFQGFIVQLSMSLLLQNSFCFGNSFNNFQWWISPWVMILLTPHLQQETSYILTSGNQREGHLFAIWLGFLQPVCLRYPRLVFLG